MSSRVIYSGKMTVPSYMDDENLYIVFPEGMADGNIADVLGTWTKNTRGTKNAPLTMFNYTCQYITDTEFYITKDDDHYRLKVEVVSDSEINVFRLNDRDEVVSVGSSTLTKLT